MRAKDIRLPPAPWTEPVRPISRLRAEGQYPRESSTRFESGLPANHSSSSRNSNSVCRCHKRSLTPLLCGVRKSLGAFHSAESAGNGSTEVTSSAAPPRWPLLSAETRAASSSNDPRPMLISRAPRLISAICPAPIRCWCRPYPARPLRCNRREAEPRAAARPAEFVERVHCRPGRFA